MHSNIYQVSIQPIEVDDYSMSGDYYDNSDDFADYVGDELDEDEREDAIRHLASTLRDIFDLDEKDMTLVYNGKIKEFKEKWAAAIHDAESAINADNVLAAELRYKLEKLCNKTHLDTDYRFDNVDYCEGLPDDPASLIAFVSQSMKKGDKLYIGQIVDYHR